MKLKTVMYISTVRVRLVYTASLQELRKQLQITEENDNAIAG